MIYCFIFCESNNAKNNHTRRPIHLHENVEGSKNQKKRS